MVRDIKEQYAKSMGTSDGKNTIRTGGVLVLGAGGDNELVRHRGEEAEVSGVEVGDARRVLRDERLVPRVEVFEGDVIHLLLLDLAQIEVVAVVRLALHCDCGHDKGRYEEERYQKALHIAPVALHEDG